MNKAEAGRLGGQATAQKYGSDHMSKIGRKGFEVTTEKYFEGDEAAHTKWLGKLGRHTYFNQLGFKADWFEKPVHPSNDPNSPYNRHTDEVAF